MMYRRNLLLDYLHSPKICLIFDFHKPPYGGGNQFLRALVKRLKSMGQDIAINSWGRNTRCVMINSYNFDRNAFIKLKQRYPHVKIVHRVDGPISVYRGDSTDIDREICDFNNNWADATIIQSKYSFQSHQDLGLDYRDPMVITNACDNGIFYPRQATLPTSKTRLVASAWSNNKKKGADFYKYLDETLDFNRYELAFVGRIDATFKNIKIIKAVDSHKLAKILRDHHIYIAASQDDPCSNALIEALSTGLPTIYHNSGGHPELVGEAGESFLTHEQLLKAIDKVSGNLTYYQSKIKVESIDSVAKQYSILIEKKLNE